MTPCLSSKNRIFSEPVWFGPLGQQLAHATDLLGAELLVRDQVREKQLRRTFEQLVRQVLQCLLACSLLLATGKVAVSAPLFIVIDVSLGFQPCAAR